MLPTPLSRSIVRLIGKWLWTSNFGGRQIVLGDFQHSVARQLSVSAHQKEFESYVGIKLRGFRKKKHYACSKGQLS